MRFDRPSASLDYIIPLLSSQGEVCSFDVPQNGNREEGETG